VLGYRYFDPNQIRGFVETINTAAEFKLPAIDSIVLIAVAPRNVFGMAPVVDLLTTEISKLFFNFNRFIVS